MILPYRRAINQISAVPGHVHVYAFNIPDEEIGLANNLLDKEEERKSMKITYDDDFNFVIRYIPSAAHGSAACIWTWAVCDALRLITTPGHGSLVGIELVGSTTFQLGPRKKQADAGVRPTASPSGLPSVVLEVGSSESIRQLRIDMKLWIEHTVQVQLAILLSIDPPAPPNPNTPRITVELWRGFDAVPPPGTPGHRMREGRRVWQADWTVAASPLYILLSDIFRGQIGIPAAYNGDQIFLDTILWRQTIINNYP